VGKEEGKNENTTTRDDPTKIIWNWKMEVKLEGFSSRLFHLVETFKKFLRKDRSGTKREIKILGDRYGDQKNVGVEGAKASFHQIR